MGNRKEAEKFLLGMLKKVTKNGNNTKIYEERFKSMNDKEFDQFVNEIENYGGIPIYLSNVIKDDDIVYTNILKLAKELGTEFEQYLFITDDDTGLVHKTAEKHLVGPAPVRKQRQMLSKQMTYAKDDSNISDLTGQAYGDSKGAGFSFQEANILRQHKMINTAKEFYDVLGGDLDALKSFRENVENTGTTNITQNLKQGSGVQSVKTLHYLLRARYINNNLNKR